MKFNLKYYAILIAKNRTDGSPDEPKAAVFVN